MDVLATEYVIYLNFYEFITKVTWRFGQSQVRPNNRSHGAQRVK
jgi:hypothetical protein